MADSLEALISQTATPRSLGTPQSVATPEVYSLDKISLADLCAKGTAHFAHRNFSEAADHFAQASELQAELNGEMAPENAEILFLYGRSLFKVAQSNSDVLGGKAAGDKKKAKANGAAKSTKADADKKETETETEAGMLTEEGVAVVAAEHGIGLKAEEAEAKKPLFQFTGDENFEDSENEDEGAGDGDEQDDDDDFAVAFEVLDLARVLFARRLEEPEEADDEVTDSGDSSLRKHLKERLADTHDLLAEISLENERFPAAVADFRAALKLKEQLYPEESEINAEAHYKLSLALEFASISSVKEDEAAETPVDEAMRAEAITELEAAINCTRIKCQKKEDELAASTEEDEMLREQIADVKEIIADMEGRLNELSGPLISVKEALYGPSGIAAGQNAGILGAVLGESHADAAARIEEAKKTANDLSGLVRHKKGQKSSNLATPEPQLNPDESNGKRRAEEDPEDATDVAKKAKVENAPRF